MNEQQRDAQRTGHDAGREQQHSDIKRSPASGAYGLQQAARMINAGFPPGMLPREALERMVSHTGNSLAAGMVERELRSFQWTSQAMPAQFAGSAVENILATAPAAGNKPPMVSGWGEANETGG